MQVLAHAQQPAWRQFMSHGPEVVAKCVCRDCNGGWMKDLDASAQPVLERLLFSLDRQVLSLAEQRVLASWATKIAMMLDYAPRPVGYVSSYAHKRMYEDGLPPNDTYVWLAGRDYHEPFIEDIVGSKLLQPHDRKVFTTTFRIGLPMFQVFLPEPLSGIEPMRAGFANYLIQLWPLTFKPAVWPPPALFERTTAGLMAFANSLRFS
jgi:hypothetical protein